MTIIRSLSCTQKNAILSQLDAGDFIHSIASTTGVFTGTISMLHSNKHSDLQKSTGGCPTKLSSAIVYYAIYFISAHMVETAVGVTKHSQISPTNPFIHVPLLNTWRKLG